MGHQPVELAPVVQRAGYFIQGIKRIGWRTFYPLDRDLSSG